MRIILSTVIPKNLEGRHRLNPGLPVHTIEILNGVDSIVFCVNNRWAEAWELSQQFQNFFSAIVPEVELIDSTLEADPWMKNE